MALTKREERVISAFINCIVHGEYTEDYAITLIEDNARYGWLSDAAKDEFYERLETAYEPPKQEEQEVEPIPYEPPQEEEPEYEPEPVDHSEALEVTDPENEVVIEA